MGFNAKKIKTTKQNIKKKNGGISDKLNSNTSKKQIVSEENVRFEQRIFFNNQYDVCYFKNCHFEKGFQFTIPSGSSSGKVSKTFNIDIFLIDCRIDNAFILSDCTFEKKFRIHDCEIHNKASIDNKLVCNFENTKFNDLADFWRTTFNIKTIFYKTDFNATAVFSFVTFYENVLFTYTLFAGKTIFAKTNFMKGMDISQAVIQGNLQLFDLRFKFKLFDADYVGEDHSTYQENIDKNAIIPLVNKVHTFQILKKGFVDIGNYSDSILMQREEKRALRKLIQRRLNDEDVDDVNFGDKLILWLNKKSNNYQSDFICGIGFTFIMVILFGVLTLIFTEAFHRNICLCDNTFNEQTLIKGVEFLFNFLNPTRNITYLEKLEPTFFGIAYVSDFFGRIAVGYGFYQTIQAFRKFK